MVRPTPDRLSLIDSHRHLSRCVNSRPHKYRLIIYLSNDFRHEIVPFGGATAYFLTPQSSKYICSEIEGWKKVYNHHCFSEKSQNHETLRIHLLLLTDLFNFKSDSLEIKIQYR